MKTDVLQYAFGRKGGVSFDVLQTLGVFVPEEFQVLDEVTENYILVKEELIESLYRLIKNIECHDTKNHLLNMKRDVFNDRDIQKYLSTPLLDDGNTKMLIAKYSETKKEKNQLESVVENLYQNCLAQSVSQLKKISEMFFFKNGLLFSSDSMIQNIKQFREGSNQLKGKKEKRMILSLLRYITRSGAKTSPFSSYNTIFALQYEGNKFSPVTIAKPSIISITNLVFLVFSKILLNVPEIKRTFLITLNPTIKVMDSVVNYFYNTDNNEAFYNANKSEILAYIINSVSEKEVITYNELLSHIGSVTEDTKENVGRYLDKLIASGILIIKLPVFINDREWPVMLLRILENIKHNIANDIVLILNQLIQSKNMLERTINVRERENICNQAYFLFVSKISQIIQTTGISELNAILSKISATDLFYEDTVTDKVNFSKEPASLNFDKIGFLNRMFQHNTLKSEFRKEFAKQIKELYNEQKISLLEFYQDVYLKNEYPETVTFNYQTGIINLFGEFLKSLHQLRDCEEIDIEPYIREYRFDAPASCDVFTQAATINGRNMLVVNNILPGGGTNISRFASLYHQYNINEVIRQNLNDFHENSIVTHITDAAIHNTNTFPAFTDYIIDVSLKAGYRQKYVDLRNLYICMDNKKHVRLEDSSGREVVPVNFSMETILRKSALMKFIDIFNDNSPEGLPTLLEIYEKFLATMSGDEPVIFIPRLCYANDIVLSRRKWLVKKSFLSAQVFSHPLESMQFKLFKEWREATRIPKHFFIKEKINDNASKPQYINADAPIFFMLLRNQLSTDGEFIMISEMLPSHEHLSKNEDDERFVTEYIFSFMDKN